MGEILEIIVSMMGGLALFLYGMRMMSNGLELVAGNQMKSILGKLTSNRFVSIIVGAAVTALVQSSSATTVMLVSFVGSGIMTLEQAVWIIMGANIGATMTNMLTALNISMVACILAIVGVGSIVFIKKTKVNNLGLIIAGLGILFIGMELMSAAVEPLKEVEAFRDIMATFTNPLIGVLFGALFTAMIQSSSASIGILQSLSVTGAISMQSSVYLIFGMNIGTCITAAIASLGGSRDAKRTAMIHFLFNVIGTVIFVIGIQFIPFAEWMAMSSADPKVQIANANIIYKIISTVLLLPFGKKLVDMSRMLIRGSDEEPVLLSEVGMHRFGGVGNTAVVVTSLSKEIDYMMHMVIENLKLGIDALLHHDASHKEELYEREQRINHCRSEVTRYMNTVSALELQPRDSEVVMSYFKITTDLERLGDHAKNLMGYAVQEQTLNPEALAELNELQGMMKDALHYFRYNRVGEDLKAADAIENIEKSVDYLTEEYQNLQMKRLKDKLCSPTECVLYSNILIDIERIFDHMMNILEECRDHNYSVLTSEITSEQTRKLEREQAVEHESV